MTAFASLAALALFSAPGYGGVNSPAVSTDTVLIEFSSPQCVHCRTMQPVIDRLKQQGCPVQVIDTTLQPDVARQFQITGVPTFVMLAGGRETGRVVGAATYERLAALVGATQARSASEGIASSTPNNQPTNHRADSSANAEQAATAATVRLQVEDAKGLGFGTGTIIDTHEGEALVVTCGHLFRESKGQGKIAVDVFGAANGRSLPGQLIAYDLDRDIALVSVRVAGPVRAASIAPPGSTVRPGQRVFTIGCDKGQDPSVRQSHITAVNKYLGKPNYTAAGQPVDGRSGGGLFTSDGLLIGICNAADPADDEGLYAGLASIHWQLDQIGQSEIYQRAARGQVEALANAAPAAAATAAALERSAAPQLPAELPGRQLALTSATTPSLNSVFPTAQTASSGNLSETAPVAAADDDAEIVFIVRSKRNPTRQSEVYVVDQAPPDLVARITQAARASGQQRAAIAQQARAANSPAAIPAVVRGQSAD